VARLATAEPAVAYRVAVLVLWGLAANAAIACRGLFWDGSSFLVNIIELGEVHDFYTARAHVDWVTQAPVLLLLRLGVRDIHVLATIYSAALFALPVALYHVALARLRGNGVALAIAMVMVLMVWLPTSFFVVGEYNATYAAVLAAMAVTLVPGRNRLADAVGLVLLGLLAVRSYESMLYLGPLVAAAILWSWRDEPDARLRGLSMVAALGFAAGAIVAGATIVDYWSHPHFVKVRATSIAFWQNLQVVIPADSASCSRVAIAAGVPAGAKRPTHSLTSKPGRPLSARVGTSGRLGWRRAVATARKRARPDSTTGRADSAVMNTPSRVPAARSRAASAPPR